MSYRRFCALVVLASFSLPASAQETKAPETPAKPTKPAASAPKSGKQAQPSVTSTIYGDWTLRCQAATGSRPRLCEITQIIEEKAHSAPIAKISVGRPSGKEMHVAVILPNNVSFPSSVHIRTSDKDKWGLGLDWQRCIPGACFADAVLPDATITYWHGLDTIGTIVFQDAGGDQVSLPMTFHGFGQALDALAKS